MGETGCDIWGKGGVSADSKPRTGEEGVPQGAERRRELASGRVGWVAAKKEQHRDMWGKRGATYGVEGVFSQ